MLQYDAKGVKEEEIIVRISAPNIVEVEFTLETRRVFQNVVRYDGGTEGDRRI